MSKYYINFGSGSATLTVMGGFEMGDSRNEVQNLQIWDRLNKKNHFL